MSSKGASRKASIPTSGSPTQALKSMTEPAPVPAQDMHQGMKIPPTNREVVGHGPQGGELPMGSGKPRG